MAAEDGDIPPNATLYVRNLDERIKLPRLTEMLREMFSEYGSIVDIVARKNIKARGQAFVVYDSVESASEALEELQDFDLDGIPMRLAYAKTRSDKIVEREDGEEGLEQHKRRRLAEKERKQAVEAAAQQQKAAAAAAKRPADNGLAERPAKTSKAGGAGTGATGVVPDEYLPPNKILFLRELPEDYGKEAIAAVFSRYPGFKEVRTVPGRKAIAFVEYESEEGAIAAKEATAGMTLGEKTIRVTFQRQ